ncbi:MAG: primosomal protein N' [Patescibacteria group bacterium]
MNYYDVLVATKNKHFQLFTYSSTEPVDSGAVVQVSFRGKKSLGVVVAETGPNKKALKLDKTDYKIPAEMLQASLNLAKISASSWSGIAGLLVGPLSLSKSRLTHPAHAATNVPPKLTTPQKKVVTEAARHGATSPILIHGVTGSGKSRVYLELVKRTLDSGRSCIIMSPEVGLSNHLYEYLRAHINEPIYQYSSGLTRARRSHIWKTVSQSKTPLVIVGPRSSLFCPLSNLGLIVLDEFHDSSYKQDNDPRYSSLHMASLLSREHQCLVVCGSATPNVEDYYWFSSAGYPILELPEKALKDAAKPQIDIVDLASSNHKGLLSKAALRQISSSIENDHQSLVYLNRRGNNRLVKCSQCDWIANCHECEYRLVLHKDMSRVVCHVCGQKQQVRSTCPKCSSSIEFRSPGIKELAGEVSRAFPDAPTFRFDSDQNKNESLSEKLPEATSTKSAIIIGTQMISKGLDLPLLEAVVIVNAEDSLTIPDFRANERLFQQINQIIGRVGRGHIEKTHVVLQTYQPNNQTILDAVDSDWHRFYERELVARKRHGLPPFKYSASIRVRRASSASAQRATQKLADKLSQLNGLNITGPSPAMQEKIAGKYEWVINVFSPKRSMLLDLAKKLEGSEIVELDPSRLL